MANLTLSIDDDLLRQARIKALERGTSVNAIVRDYLQRLVGQDAQDPLTTFFEIGDRSGASSGSAGRSWTRDELYDR